jgi:sensor histidine kinase YesM
VLGTGSPELPKPRVITAGESPEHRPFLGDNMNERIEAVKKAIDIIKLQFEVLNSTLRTSFDAFNLLTVQLEELEKQWREQEQQQRTSNNT